MNWNLDADAFAAVVSAATRAPSMYNSQPWLFRYDEHRIDVLLDPAHAPSVAGRLWAARLSCGAAVFNLRLALAVRGTPAVAHLCPDPAEPDLVARLTPGPSRPPTREESRLYAAIGRRHSNRYPFRDQPVPANVRTALQNAARDEGAWLDLVPGTGAVDAIAALVRVADDTLHTDPDYRAELAHWTRHDEPYVDGVSAREGGPAPRPGDLLTRRDFGGPPLPDRRRFEADPLVAVLGAPGDWPADQVQAGQALQRILLTATDLGLAASMFSQPIEVPAAREQLRLALHRTGDPQMVLRVGYADLVPASHRRPVAEVILERVG